MNKLLNISFIRVVSTFSIIFCHIFAFINWGKISNVLSSAIYIFFFISGFLFSKKIINIPFYWYINRLVRILIPIYIYLFILSFINKLIFKDIDISYVVSHIVSIGFYDLIGCVINGFKFGHLWFITYILIAYALTPYLQNYKKYKCLIVILFFLLHLLFSLFVCNGPLIRFVGIVLYAYAYYYGENIINLCNKKYIYFILIGLIVFCLLKFGINQYTINNKIIYNIYQGFICEYYRIFIALFSMLVLLKIYKICDIFLQKTQNVLLFFDKISFEMYITHFSFIAPCLISLLFITKFMCLNIFMIFFAVVLSSIILNFLTNIVLTKIIKVTK